MVNIVNVARGFFKYKFEVMTMEVQEVNNKIKKEKLKSKHQEEGFNSNLRENQQIVKSNKKSKKNKKKKYDNTASQDIEDDYVINISRNAEKVKGKKCQFEEDESPSRKKIKLKKNKKNADKRTSNRVDKNSRLENDNAEKELEDENEEEKQKKEPSNRQLKREKAAIREAETKKTSKQANTNKALNYVSKWKHVKSEWKFSKVIQTWLINNLFDENYVPHDQYSTVLEYFEFCKGSARKQLVDKAMAVIKKLEEQLEKDEEIVETTEYKRARQLLQALPTET